MLFRSLESGYGQMVVRHLAAVDAGVCRVAGLGVEPLFASSPFGLCPAGAKLPLKRLARLAERCWMAASPLEG